MDFNEKKFLFKVRKTVLEMLTDRGYTITDLYNINFTDFSILVDSNKIDIIAKKPNNEEVYVYFYTDSKNFGKNEFKNSVASIKENNENDINIILVINDKINDPVKKEMIKPQYKNVEIFMKKLLTFNITRHDLVPKHTLLTEDEIQKIVDKYNTPKHMFPKMLSTDPVAKYYGVKPGDMFEITRKSASVGKCLSYRIVK